MFSVIRWRFISYYLVVFTVIVLVMGTFFIIFLNYFYRENLRSHLFAQARLAALLVDETAGQEGTAGDLDLLCKNLGNELNLRVTLVDLDGTVIGDSSENPAIMDNHLIRPEIQEALSSGKGVAERYSSTIGQYMYYAAISIYSKDAPHSGPKRVERVIRLAIPLSEIHEAVWKVRLFVIIVLIVFTAAALLLGIGLSQKITNPLKAISAAARSIARGEFEPTLEVGGRDEMAKLAQTIREMGLSLRKKVQQILLEKTKLEAVISSADSGIVMVDRALRIELVNPAAEKIFNVTRHETVGVPVQVALRYYSLFENLKAVYEYGRPRNFELSLYYPRSLILQASLVPVVGARGEVMGVLALFHDITSIRSVEQMRSDFVANVSHELRTPLTAIKGYTETVLDKDLTEEQLVDFFRIIDREAGRLARLIDSLLDLSKIEGHKDMVNKEAVNLVDLCRKALLDLEELHRQKKTVIRVSLPDSPLYIYGNADWLRQAVVNILENSINHGYSDGVIEMRIVETEGRITMEIQDNGPGIPEADLPYVFERFYRVDKSRTRKSGGTGLGLAIVKHIMEAHDAVYAIESSPGRGTIFRFSLPRYHLIKE
ncbi:MAG: ATP-binding protein [Bacillota bacterium]